VRFLQVTLLEYLGFIKYGRLTCGGDMLFCINPAKRFPQARVKAVCYKTDKIDNDYIDMKSFEGPIVQNLEAVFAFVKRNIPNQMKFNSNSLTREEKPIYPPEAIREGLVNAFAHRDYADFRGSILVQIFADRLEIHNSGRFLDGITSDTIAKGQISLLRNPDIAHTLYTRKYMEKLGRGGMLIRKACQEYGLVEPKWSEDTNGVTLTFFANAEVTAEVTAEVSEEVQKLLILLEPNKEYTKKELQEKVGLKHDEYFRKSYMLPLLDMKILEMTIPDKPKSSKQKYRLTKKGNRIQNDR
jgi:ATP-dependent DNA helicase RecG